MAFRERIELLIDITTTGARSAMNGLKRDVDDTDSAFGKLKTGVSNTFGGLGNMITSGAAVAGAALVGFATKAVSDFQKVALESGRMSDRLGVTAEEASRLIEVAGDLGVETATLEGAINRMNRTAATSPEKFDAIGAAIARNRDGTINVVQTFKNAAEAIDRIPDAATRAKVAQEIFGKGWQGIAELIQGGAKGIREAMESVEDGKVIDDAEVAKAREFRDTMDALKGAFESFAIEAGGHIVQIINGFDELATAADEAFRWATLRDARQMLYDNVVAPIKQIGDEMDATFNQDASLALDAFKRRIELLQFAPLIADLDALRTAMMLAGDTAIQHTGPGLTDLGYTSEMLADRQRELADEFRKSADSMLNAADASINLEDAQQDVEDAIWNTIAVSQNSESTTNDLRDAVDRERDAIIRAAGAARDKAAADQTAAGVTVSAKAGVDAFNSSLLNNARNATPAAKDAIAQYIIQANGIPASKATQITAAIRAGDIPLANQLINDASRTRTAAINADANTAQAEGEINHAARPRTATIRVVTTGANAAVAVGNAGAYGPTYRAGGGSIPNLGGDNVVVGENGPEVVRLPVGSHVYKENETRNFDTPGRGGDTFVINGTTAAEVVSQIQAIRWRENAMPTPGARR